MSSYSKEHSEGLTSLLNQTDGRRPDVTEAPDSVKIRMLASLVKALETGLTIVHKTHYAEPHLPEPFPGACEAVVKQAITGIRIARASGLIP